MEVCIVCAYPPNKCGVANYSAKLVAGLSRLTKVLVFADVLDSNLGVDDPVANVLRVWRRNSFLYPLTIDEENGLKVPRGVHAIQVVRK